MSPTQELRALVRARFFPYVEAKEFARAKSTHPQFTIFRRIVGHNIQILSVQWDKYGDARFIVNFGEGPKAGVRLWGRHIPAEVMEPNDCPESGRLQRTRGPYLRSWFQLKKPIGEALWTMTRRYSAEAVAEHLLSLFPEIESWWLDRTVGQHLSINAPDTWRIANAVKAAG